MSSKGMIYTTFAVLSATLLLMVSTVPLQSSVDVESGQATRIGEAAFFMESVLGDMDRSLGIATRRALTGASNYVIQEGRPLVAPRENLTSALVNGSISGVELNSTENASLQAWTQKVASIAADSGYVLEVELNGTDFNSSGFKVQSSYQVFARLEDPVTLAAFNRTRTSETEVSVDGLEDSMILLQSQGRYVSQYRDCGISTPAELLDTGQYYSPGSVHGEAVVNPADASSVPNSGEKILAVDDVDDYTSGDVNGFAGVVSAEQNSSSGYSIKQVFDLDSASTVSDAGIEQNMSIILHEDGVWHSSFRKMFQDDCYVPVDGAPGVFERMANELVGGEETGLATLIEVTRLPPELQQVDSSVGYVYFNDSGGYGPLYSIRGVTNEYSWFRIDDYHVDLWGLEDLAY